MILLEFLMMDLGLLTCFILCYVDALNAMSGIIRVAEAEILRNQMDKEMGKKSSLDKSSNRA